MRGGERDVKEERSRVVRTFIDHLDRVIADHVGEIKRFVVVDHLVIVNQLFVEEVVSATAFEAEHSLEATLKLGRSSVFSGLCSAVPFTRNTGAVTGRAKYFSYGHALVVQVTLVAGHAGNQVGHVTYASLVWIQPRE